MAQDRAPMKPVAFFVTGAIAFGAAQALWSIGHAQGLWRGTWMLKTGGGMAACFALFVVVSAVACSLRERGRGYADCIVALVAGAAAAATVALFFVGPGSLWPLVIVLDTIVVAIAAAAGAALSRLVRGPAERSEPS